MRTISHERVRNCLTVARDVAQDHLIVDCHVHATDVVSGIRPNPYEPEAAGSVSERSPPAPLIGQIRELEPQDFGRISRTVRNRTSELLFRRAYQDLGPSNLIAEMSAAHVGAALLLPVGPINTGVDDQLRFLERCRSYDKRMHLAFSVSGIVATEDIGDTISAAVTDYDVRALKVHPNLSAIDIRTSEGIARIETLLQSAARFDLPVIVHGGSSPILAGSDAADFSILDNLRRIDWSGPGTSVILAHCGLYGIDEGEIDSEFQKLDKLLLDHPEMLVDTSGLSSRILIDVLQRISLSRVLFGSDALYVPMWRAMAILIHALDHVGHDSRTALTTVASVTPRSVFRL